MIIPLSHWIGESNMEKYIYRSTMTPEIYKLGLAWCIVRRATDVPVAFCLTETHARELCAKLNS